MIKHIVMFKLADKNNKNMEDAIAALNTLKGNIETLNFIEIGTDFLCSERSYDIVLTAHFDDQDGLKTYAGHKNHLPVVDKMRSLCSSSIVVDYESE
jgi:hypothetical protein